MEIDIAILLHDSHDYTITRFFFNQKTVAASQTVYYPP